MDLVHAETPAEFFEDEIVRAMDRQNVATSQESKAYLVELLEAFVRPDRLWAQLEVEPDRPLAEIFCTAFTSDGMRKFLLLKFSGDLSLFSSGFFPDSLASQAVDVDYYIKLGGSAYATAAHDCRSYANAELFGELALRFGDLVDVLNEVSEHCALVDSTNLLRLYERYLRTGSRGCARKLQQAGIATAQGGLDEIH